MSKRTDAWLALRALRADPPGAAAGKRRKPMKGRRAVFSSALDQSEQLFSAAADSPYGIRPMLVFYGMSQASRAIAAASTDPRLLTNDSWRLEGHGLGCGGERIKPKHLADVLIEPRRGRSTFRTMQDVLGSPRWEPPDVRLGAVLAACPGLLSLPGRTDPPAINYLVDQMTIRPDGAKVIGRVHATVPDHLIGPSGSARDATRHYHFFDDATAVAVNGPPVDGWQPITADFDTTLGEDQSVWQASRTVTWPGGGSNWIVPNLGGVTGPQHPFVLVWAALFALSMRARYEPKRWTNDLDPDDDDSYATAVEKTLDDVRGLCPALIAQAIADVT